MKFTLEQLKNTIPELGLGELCELERLIRLEFEKRTHIKTFVFTSPMTKEEIEVLNGKKH